MGYLNLGSLMMGVLALGVPVYGLSTQEKKTTKIVLMSLTVSFTAMALALFFQIAYTFYLVSIEDFGALKDTQYAVFLASFVLLAATVILNVIELYKHYHKT